MASTISRNEGQPVSLADFATDVARRRAACEKREGKPFMIPRNSGMRRTESKRALLEAIDEAGGKW